MIRKDVNLLQKNTRQKKRLIYCRKIHDRVDAAVICCMAELLHINWLLDKIFNLYYNDIN